MKRLLAWNEKAKALQRCEAFFTNRHHLGNVRATVNSSGTVVQRDGYYPFGLTFNHSNVSPENDYKYNGFEEQKETGWYDYQARFYDPALGRFLNVDPAADLMRRHSTYSYAFNNPIRFIDPDGMMPSDQSDQHTDTGSPSAATDDEDGEGGDGDGKGGSKTIKRSDYPDGEEGDRQFARAIGEARLAAFQEGAAAVETSANGEMNSLFFQVSEGGDGFNDAQQAGLELENLRGPALIALGAPILEKRFVTKATSTSKAASKGTSIASKFLAKLLPYRSRGIKRFTAQVFGKSASTAVLGRALGRAVPYAGWALTIHDTNQFLRETFPAYKELQDAGGGIGGPTYVGSDGVYVCFTGGTLIYTENGLKLIEELEKGMKVYSYNFSTDRIELQPITKFITREVQKVYKLEAGEEQIMVTAEHPFYMKGKDWVKVKDLVPGDQLLSDDGNEILITKISVVEKAVIVYNIEVLGNHNYFVTPSKVLVHNKNIIEKTELKNRSLESSKSQRKE